MNSNCKLAQGERKGSTPTTFSFYLEHNLAEKILAGGPNTEKEDRCMYWRKKWTIQPSATLRNKLRHLKHKWNGEGQDTWGIITVVGTSVEAFALLTYFKLPISEWVVRKRLQKRGSHLHPTLTLFCDNFEAKNTVLSKIHVSLMTNLEQHIEKTS